MDIDKEAKWKVQKWYVKDKIFVIFKFNCEDTIMTQIVYKLFPIDINWIYDCKFDSFFS